MAGRKLLLLSCILFAFPFSARADENLVELVKKTKPAVVLIQTFNDNNQPIGKGSGFFVNNKGHIVTNYHVLEGAYRATVKISNGKEYPVEGIIAKNADADIVKIVVNIPDANTPFLNLSEIVPSEGQDIVVIGNPLGLESTVSSGIVSAIRDIPAFGKIIQITAPISPGSSGSPVINSKGEVIGIATLIATSGQNLNFAVPSNKIIALKENARIPIFNALTADSNDIQLSSRKGIKESWVEDPNRVILGAHCVTFDKDVRRVFIESKTQPPQVKGIILTNVIENGPAEKAGLKELDYLFKINGQPILDTNELTRIMNEIGAGHEVSVEYFRFIQQEGKKGEWKRQKVFLTPIASREITCQSGQCPLQIKGAMIINNSIDEPVLVVNLSNIGSIDIEAFAVEILCFNKFDEPVLGLDKSNRISAIGQSAIKPFEKIRHTITLHYRDTVGKLKIAITRIKFKNGDEWNREPNDISFYIAEK